MAGHGLLPRTLPRIDSPNTKILGMPNHLDKMPAPVAPAFVITAVLLLGIYLRHYLTRPTELPPAPRSEIEKAALLGYRVRVWRGEAGAATGLFVLVYAILDWLLEGLAVIDEVPLRQLIPYGLSAVAIFAVLVWPFTMQPALYVMERDRRREV